ncbi:hypothetical protein [Gordonia sp. ABSL49_1]|uniref:hypothetical protein n=1 Tax=Gordonia sp. ABSL49_1 TaxID=2920941 RepID=UPI001F1030F6|nr:hypothetical protein [Gordonia sp. ABSL49_1]MCH5645359.1 hypothetical protein [Gordonia sp. ABSL49_1]
MTAADFWTARPVLEHVRDFARARRVPPLAMLASLTVRAIGSLDPNIVGPPVIGGYSSLNCAVAYVGPSGFGKGATEAAARDATNLPALPELPLGTGEGMARTFAANDEGQQEIRSAIFTASEVDGLAALGARTGATVMSVFRQAISGESIGSANAQKHTRVIVPAHSYRAVFTIGVQPERAQPLIGDTAGTAQRILWVPTSDPDAPERRPSEPDRWTVPRTLVPGDRRTVLRLPDEAVEAMDRTQLGKLHGDPDINPLDGHALMTRAKIAAGLMVLDGRMREVTIEDWELAGVLMRESDRTRDRVAAVLADSARRVNRAKAHAVAERDDVVAEKKVQRAANGIVARLERSRQVLSKSDLRKALRSDLRPEFQPAIDRLIGDGLVAETPHGYTLTGGQVDSGVHPDNSRSEQVDTPVHVDTPRGNPPGKTPPGGITPTTPGVTARVLEILHSTTGTTP